MTLSIREYESIGQVMCDVTKDHLLSHSWNWLTSKAPGIQLKIRVGSGKSTHLKSNRDKPIHTITYGREMVRMKHDMHLAGCWLGTQEIIEHGYGGKDITYTDLLAHTCLHEFSHLIQRYMGWRLDNSVHNTGFYKILSKMYINPVAAEMKADFDLRLKQQNLSTTFSCGAEAYPRNQIDYMKNIAVGMPVEYKSGCNIVLAKVEKVNPKYIHVKTEDGILGIPKFQAFPTGILRPEI